MISKLAILLIVCSAAFAQPRYILTNLGTLPGAYASIARGINDSGQVVGDSDGRVFLYSGGIMADLGDGFARSINNSGQVAGTSGFFPMSRAFSYSEGVKTDLGTLGGNNSEANGINESGQVAGFSQNSSGHNCVFLYSGGMMTDLGPGTAQNINDYGQVVGESAGRAVLIFGSETIDLGALLGAGLYSLAYSINNSGQVVGFNLAGSGSRAFLYSGGVMTDLGPGIAYGINDSGQVVGENGGSAFLYSGGKRINIHDTLVNGGGWTNIRAQAINNRGQIVGSGTFNGQIRALLLTPVPDWLVSNAGVYRNGQWFTVTDSNGNHIWDDEDASHIFWFGLKGDFPVMGDWNGDGHLKPGIYRDGAWFTDWNGNHIWDDEDAAHLFWFGYQGDVPIMGDWNGDGHLKPGIYRDGQWFLDWNGNHIWDDEDAAHLFWFGYQGDVPVMGDWNGDGHQKPGVYRDGLWFADWNGNHIWDDEDAAHLFWFGLKGDVPVIGDWNGDGHLKPGVYRDGQWFADWNGNHIWDDEDASHLFWFGLPGDLPLVGTWQP